MQLVFAFPAHEAAIKAIAISRDGRLAATASSDETVQVFDLAKRRSVSQAIGAHNDPVTHVAFAGDLVLSGDAAGRILMFRHGKAIHELRGHKADSAVSSIAVHPSNGVALSTAGDNSLRLWDLVNAKAAPRMRFDDFKTLACACWSPDGALYGFVGDEKTVVVKNPDAVDERPLGTMVHPKRVNDLAFIEDVVLVSACDDGVLRVIGADGSLVRSFACAQDGERPVRMRAAAGCKLDDAMYVFGACSDGVVRVWDIDDDDGNDPVALLKIGTAAHVVCMAVAPLARQSGAPDVDAPKPAAAAVAAVAATTATAATASTTATAAGKKKKRRTNV